MSSDPLLDLNDALPDLMRQWSPCDNDSDYKCVFCHERAETNVGDVKHRDDCLGVRLVDCLS